MKKILKTKIRIIVTLMAAVVIGGCFVSSALAYYSDLTGEKINTFTVGNVTTEIKEKVDAEGTKEPSVQNTGKNAALIRMRVGISPNDAKVEIGGWDEKWWTKQPVNGFYYYQGVVESGQSTTPLFKSYSIDKENFAPFEITLYQEAVQAEAVDDQGEVLRAIDSDGDYAERMAARIWSIYDQK